MSESGWVWFIHSRPDTNFVQEVEQLERQKNEAKDKESRKDIELKLKLKTLERALAGSKYVSQGNKFTMAVVCYEVSLSLPLSHALYMYILTE